MNKFGFAQGTYDARPDDGLALVDCMVTNAVRCVPPQNKPVGAEINQCREYLTARIDSLPNLSAMLALGRIAHDAVLKSRGQKISAFKFGHCAEHDLDGVTLFDSYHCSRYNTNTGVLTTEMFEAVFRTDKASFGRVVTSVRRIIFVRVRNFPRKEPRNEG